ncbi:MAG: hypothetical protein WCJ95_21665 [Mariniphaga sp.]
MKEADLKKLREFLPRGYRKEISTKLQFTQRFVDLVLQGKRVNNEIMRMAVEMAIKNQQDLKYIQERVAELKEQTCMPG